MEYIDDDEPKKPGPKGIFSPELGAGVKKNPRFPAPIFELLYDDNVKRVLNRMALDPDFKAKVLGMVEEENGDTD